MVTTGFHQTARDLNPTIKFHNFAVENSAKKNNVTALQNIK